RGGARGDDRAGDHRGHPRGVRAGADRASRGGPRTGCDPLGDGAHRGVAVRTHRLRQRLDARPGPCARRDDGAVSDPADHRPGLLLVAVRRRGHDRLEDRPGLRRVHRRDHRRRLYRHRPGAVPDHLRGQRRGPRGDRAGVKDAMTTAVTGSGPAPVLTPVRLRRRLADRLAAVAVIAATAATLVPLGWLLATVVVKGAGAVTSAGWFTHSLN